jgi:hypothetical protein
VSASAQWRSGSGSYGSRGSVSGGSGSVCISRTTIYASGRMRRRRRRKRNHDRIYNNQMVALVNGSGTNYAEQKGMVVGQCGRFWRLATQLQQPGESWNKEFRNEWNGSYCFL